MISPGCLAAPALMRGLMRTDTAGAKPSEAQRQGPGQDWRGRHSLLAPFDRSVLSFASQQRGEMAAWGRNLRLCRALAEEVKLPRAGWLQCHGLAESPGQSHQAPSLGLALRRHPGMSAQANSTVLVRGRTWGTAGAQAEATQRRFHARS